MILHRFNTGNSSLDADNPIRRYRLQQLPKIPLSNTCSKCLQKVFVLRSTTICDMLAQEQLVLSEVTGCSTVNLVRKISRLRLVRGRIPFASYSGEVFRIRLADRIVPRRYGPQPSRNARRVW